MHLLKEKELINIQTYARNNQITKQPNLQYSEDAWNKTVFLHDNLSRKLLCMQLPSALLPNCYRRNRYGTKSTLCCCLHNGHSHRWVIPKFSESFGQILDAVNSQEVHQSWAINNLPAKDFLRRFILSGSVRNIGHCALFHAMLQKSVWWTDSQLS